MKMIKIVQAVSLVLVAGIIAFGCRPGRGYHDPPRTRHFAGFSLIISPAPGFVMLHHPNGRFYHRSPQGFIYWRGHDNRFYLDRRYIHRVRYSEYEYREWKKGGRKYYKRNGKW